MDMTDKFNGFGAYKWYLWVLETMCDIYPQGIPEKAAIGIGQDEGIPNPEKYIYNFIKCGDCIRKEDGLIKVIV